MNEKQLTDFHVAYVDVTQHWSASSASYAGADALVTFMFNGWELSPVLYLEQIYYAGMRHVKIYHTELTKDGEKLNLPVLHNPYINRLIVTQGLTVIPIEEKDLVAQMA